ncbi:MAG TPA: O-antigen ligase family protein [Lacipirellulaceae bacterium]|nr:O-antigen ligase family protein [Lacipirellulaceae bacterium]
MSDHQVNTLSSDTTASAENERGYSLLIVLIILHAAGVVDSVGTFLFPSLAQTAVTTVSKVAWFSMYGWVLASLCYMYGAHWLIFLWRERTLFLAVLGIAALSPLWSLDPELSAQRVVHLWGTTLIGIYLGYHVRSDRLSTSLLIALSVLVVGGNLAAIVVPDLGQQLYEGDMAWSGLQSEKNGFGFAATTCILLCLARWNSIQWQRQRGAYMLLLPFALVALAMSKSMTSTAALALGGAVWIAYVASSRLRISVAAIACVLVAAALLAVGGGQLFGFSEWTSLVGRSSDFTGRTDVWAPTWQLILRSPLLGYGYGALWLPRIELQAMQQWLLGLNWTAYTAHNGFLQLASEIGIPAASLAFIFAFRSVAQTISLNMRRPSPFAVFATAFQIGFLLTNLFEASLFVDRSISWIIFVMIPLAVLRSYQRLSWAPSRDPQPRVWVAGSAGRSSSGLL